MSHKTKSKTIKGLSIAALVLGILTPAISVMGSIFMESVNSMAFEIAVLSMSIGLAIASVVCGSVDLKRMKKENFSKISKGFDITGIVLGTLFGLPFIAWGLLVAILS